jgi:hypothetical protein
MSMFRVQQQDSIFAEKASAVTAALCQRLGDAAISIWEMGQQGIMSNLLPLLRGRRTTITSRLRSADNVNFV